MLHSKFNNCLLIVALVSSICLIARADEYIDKLEDDESTAMRERWSQFKSEFNKTYESFEHESAAFHNFKSNLRLIEEHNAEHEDFKLGINHLADLSEQQFQEMSNGLIQDPDDDGQDFHQAEIANERELSRLIKLKNLDALPENLNWSDDRRIVGPVKNQGNCGSCWAFVVTGMLEGQERLNSTGGLVTLSEQNLIDCNIDNYGCHGGNIATALAFVRKSGGLMREDDYPYKSGSGHDDFPCQFDKSKSFITTMYLKRTIQLETGNEELLKQTLASYGPIAVAIDAHQRSFHLYKGGIYYDSKCTKKVSHSLLLVGYGSKNGQDYWLLKNSFSTEWGELGYFYLARNRDDHCGITQNAYISLAEKP